MEAGGLARLVLRGFGTTDSGELSLDLGGARAAVSIAENGAARLRARSGALLPPPSDTGRGFEPWQPVRADPQARDGGLWIAHDGPRGGARVELDADPFSLRLVDRRGATLARLGDLAFDAEGGARIRLTAREGELLTGLGEGSGGLDRTRRVLRLRNRDRNLPGSSPAYLTVPFLLGHVAGGDASGSRGLLLDAAGPCTFDLASEDPRKIGLATESDGIDVTLFPGPAPADVMRQLGERVGRPPLPPLWALGHHQSRWSYRSEAELRAVAREIRRRRIPTDVLHLDIDYMDGYRVFTWHPRRFPDPKGLIADLARQGFRVVCIVDPGVKADERWAVYRDGCQRDVFCRRDDGAPFTLRVWPGRAALPDFNRPEVRAWWGEQHRILTDAGVAGVWNDMNEPAGWARELRLGRLILPLRGQDLSRVVQGRPEEPGERVPHERVRNLYGQQQCRATRSFLEVERPGQRPFVLTRSGTAGIQRHAAAWSGDNLSRWSHLRDSIPTLLNLSLSGVGFCGADIGGFFGSCTPELYARWIQLGALYPFARTHTVWLSRRQEPWRFGRRVEQIARQALELRMRLLPYLYGLFREAEECGAPVWRPLFYEFPEDSTGERIDDQFMLGPQLLAAPVVAQGERRRTLYLPAGSWRGWHDDAEYRGPRMLTVDAPLERIPLFLRAGAIVPMQGRVQHVRERPSEPCVLEVAPGADGSAVLVEDDGETTAYRAGAFARTELRLWARAGGRLRLELGRREGTFEVPERTLRVVVRGCPADGRRVSLDGRPLAHRLESPGYHGSPILSVRFPDRGEGHSLEVDPAP